MKGKYVFESYKQFISEYNKAKSDYDRSNSETKRLRVVLHNSVEKYRKEFINLFKSLKPSRVNHKKTDDLEDDFYLVLTFNINSKDDALSTLERIILKFEDLQSEGHDMKLSVTLQIYANKGHRDSFAGMDTDYNYFRFEGGSSRVGILGNRVKVDEKYKELWIRIYLIEEDIFDTTLKPQSIASVISSLNKFEDILEKGEAHGLEQARFL